jgi:hypothetical protein
MGDPPNPPCQGGLKTELETGFLRQFLLIETRFLRISPDTDNYCSLTSLSA